MDIKAINNRLALEGVESTLNFAFEHFDRIALSFSGAEDVALLDMALLVNPSLQVFTLDTGRLHSETYEFIEKVRKHYQIAIEILSPPQTILSEFVTQKGLFSFYSDGHQECCSIRKVAPLKDKLSNLDAWITGQRQDQSIVRSNLPVFQKDLAFSNESSSIVKFNPISLWSSDQIWSYIHDNKIPYNALHDQNYKSIGCQPCTRPIKLGEHERTGRWWWELEEKKECGLHSQS